jgi:2-haloacid dehalogenase
MLRASRHDRKGDPLVTASVISTIVFDIGGVVVVWDWRHLFREFFGADAGMERFLAEVLTPAENLRCDLGTPLATVVAELSERHPEHRVPLEAWRDRWIETIPRMIDGAEALIDDLLEAGYRVCALSNFSAETFPLCRARYDVFDRFHGIVISGEEGVAKPEPGIYRLLCERCGISPGEAVLLDDSLANVRGAIAIGMRGLRFTDVPTVRTELRSLGVLAERGRAGG